MSLGQVSLGQVSLGQMCRYHILAIHMLFMGHKKAAIPEIHLVLEMNP